ncbi:MAG: cache domain-containing protein [Bacteroidales bacterium]|nr:cache domain-containing protein [Bacteroidales bacterium]
MFTKDFIHKKLPLLIFLLAFFMFILSLVSNNIGKETDLVAKKAGHRLQKRLEILDNYIVQAADWEKCDLLEMNLPDDMVIYRYVNDTLQSWCNQFSIINDDIANRMIFQRMSDMNSRIESPLADIGEELSYVSLGPKWYVVKAVSGEGNQKIIAGLEIMNTLIDDMHKSENGVNPILRIKGYYSVTPLTYGSGYPVEVNGQPLFCIIFNSTDINPFFENSALQWLAMGLLIIAALLFLAGHRTMKVYALVIGFLVILLAVSYLWGFQMNGSSELFSPTLYADGGFLFSFGALLLVNTFIFLFTLCTFYIKNRMLSFIRIKKEHRRRRMAIWGIITLASIIATFIYTSVTLRSLIMNSNISLELYRWDEYTLYTILVYISYTGLLAGILIQLQFLRPAITEFLGVGYNIFSLKSLVFFAFLFSVYFTVTASIIGFKKEQDRILVWANRLAVERDLGLEIRLRNVEDGIATDQLISTLATLDNGSGIIINRISEYYLSRIRQDYNISVMVFNNQDQAAMSYFNNIRLTGTRIADDSNFFFVKDANGRSSYAGLFVFYNPDTSVNMMILRVESNSNREDRGYYSIVGRFSNPGEINIPAEYSYAKYESERLMSYKGNYAYPTIFETEEGKAVGRVSRENGYIHFRHKVSDNEVIIISRDQRNAMVYFTSFSYLFLALAGILSIFAKKKDKKKMFKSNYFRFRINTILFTSSTLILASMTVISVLFVYKRNENNMYNLMSSKISTVQAMIESRARMATDWLDLNTSDFANILESVGNSTKTDITLYTPDGKVFRSTTPEVFEKMILGSRIDQEAFDNIMYHHQRYYIHREKIDGYNYWAMYAPIFNDNMEIIAIVCAPYTDSNYDFRREAFFHAALIINLFVLLLIASLLFSTREVNSLFAPLIEMGRKMNSADINSLEYIVYKRDDEISSLVDAYNRMVHDLSDSTRQLAQAERDKAWSQMARQVAHEIKNPLTPIKLEIQRLIRLKQKGNPAWEEKFDKVSGVVLEHIDILTDTANEFSTFAKLYDEDPVLMDLNKTLKDQLLIFDNKENVRISYIGMENALVMAPKPQLIRVFVNLLTNAIQAVEIHRQEAIDRGEEAGPGKVRIYLRNSMKDNCYDIVFDDNGPGVSEENQSRLFTPNFTTKSSGTGLGLAICRNIIEKCNGEIGYRKSFNLGGASFIVTLPKYHEE